MKSGRQQVKKTSFANAEKKLVRDSFVLLTLRNMKQPV